jgi:AhpD family alkylhydroperoxidase
MSTGTYPELTHTINQRLAPLRKTQAATMAGFGALASAALAEGELSVKHKELIALGIGISQHCAGCIAFHVKALRRLGATRGEFEEALGVAVYMGGGPAVMLAAEAMQAWEEFGG